LAQFFFIDLVWLVKFISAIKRGEKESLPHCSRLWSYFWTALKYDKQIKYISGAFSVSLKGTAPLLHNCTNWLQFRAFLFFPL